MTKPARTQQPATHARLLKKRIASFIREHGMLVHGRRLLIAVSGGPDSMVLLHLLRELAPRFKVELYVAHLHHGLRGKEADRDLAHVRRYCRNFKIPFVSKRMDVRGLARRRRLSLETAARTARYEFLSRSARRAGATAIAVGHTADDQVETFLMRMLRGAGGCGLRGMQPVRRTGDLMIIRPLLRTWRSEVLALAKDYGGGYRIDRSNRVISFFRNRVRLRLITHLQEEYSPRIKDILLRSAEILGHEHAFVHDQAARHLRRMAKARGNRISLPLRRLLSLAPALRTELLRIALGKLGAGASPGYRDIDALLGLCKGNRGAKRHLLPGGVTVSREYDRLILDAGTGGRAVDYEFPLEDGLVLRRPPLILRFGYSTLARAALRRLRKKRVKLAEAWGEKGASCWPLVEHISLDRIKGGKILVRNRRPGDRFTPFGMRGSKKLNRIMIDEKLPSRLRATVPLIVCQDEIIWLPGYRIADQYRVTPSTRRVAKVSVEKAGEM